MLLSEFYISVGGSYEDVMHRLPTEKLVIKFLRKFSIDNDYSRLYEAYLAHDLETAFQASHSMKGVAANLSLTALYNSVSDVCEAVRYKNPGSDFDELMSRCTAEYNRFLENVLLLED